MLDDLKKLITLERAELFCRVVSSSKTTEHDKEVALIWLSELLSTAVQKENYEKININNML